MILVVTVAVTVNVEGMSSIFLINTIINDGTTSSQLGDKQVGPIGLVVTGLVHNAAGAGIAPILEHVNHLIGLVRIDTATGNTVHHLLGLTDIAHQRGNSVSLCRGVGVVSILHITPVKGCSIQARIGKVHFIGIVGTDIQR